MIPRFRHILLPVDFAEKNWKALDVAFEIAIHDQTVVSLLHVIEKIDSNDDPTISDFYQRLEERASLELDTMGQRFEDAGVAVNRKVRYGRRAVEIVNYSNEHQTDLIVLSSHPIDPERPAASMGTVSYQVSTCCACAVLLVK